MPPRPTSQDEFAFSPATYGRAVQALLCAEREMELGPGQPNRAVEGQLRALSEESLFASLNSPSSKSPLPGPSGLRPVDRDMASCCLAGLWLLHDFHAESHALSQEIHTPAGSYWHALLHRREPDFDNAKYWFRRVAGDRTIAEQVERPLRNFAAIAAQDTPALDAAAEYLVTQAAWDAFRFVDLCAQAQRGGRRGDSLAATAVLCRRIQTREWQLLFDHCYRAALGQLKSR